MFDHKLLEYLESYLTEDRKKRFLEVLTKRTNYITVAMEDVYQMHNTSAVLRSCDAFGVQTVHVVEDRYGDRMDKNISVGAQKWVDVSRYQNTTDCIASLREKGYQIVATTPHDDSCALDAFEFTGKTALFFGTEWKGLSEEVMEEADSYLHIPMVGFSESLNVSVSAAIILQELTNKLRKSDLSWQLTAEELLEKRLDWTKKSIKNIEGIILRYLNG